MAVAISDCMLRVVIAAIQPVRLAACRGCTGQGGRAMNPQRFAVIAASCGMLVLIGWVAAGVAGLGLPDIKNGGAASDAWPAIALAKGGVDVPAVSLSHAGLVYAGLPDPNQMLREAPAAPASTPDPVRNDV